MKQIYSKFLLFISIIFILSHYCGTSQEIPISIDSENKYPIMTDSLADAIQIFREFPEFIDARLFKINDTLYKIQISFNNDDKKEILKGSMSKHEVDSFRLMITNKIEESKTTIRVDQSGKTGFLIGVCNQALGIWGFTVPYLIFGDTNNKNLYKFYGTYILTASTGFLIPFLLTQNSYCPISSGKLGFWGGLTGSYHGWMISLMTKPRMNTNLMLSVMTLSSIIETYAGFEWGKSANMTSGKSDLIALSNILGIGYTLGLKYASDKSENSSNQSIGTFGLIGSAAGIISGYALGSMINITDGDIKVISISGIMGGSVPLIYYTAAGNETNYKLFTGLTLATTAAGIFIGSNFISSHHFTNDEGTDIALGTLGLGIAGLGLGELIGGKLGSAILANASSIAGFYILTNHIINDPHIKTKKNKDTGFKILFNPSGLINSMSNNQINNSLINNQIHAPVLGLGFRF